MHFAVDLEFMCSTVLRSWLAKDRIKSVYRVELLVLKCYKVSWYINVANRPFTRLKVKEKFDPK